MPEKRTIQTQIELNQLYLEINNALKQKLEVEIEIKSTKEKRTLKQLGYWWAAVVPTVRAYYLENGDKRSLWEIHEILKLEHYFEETVSRAQDRVFRHAKSLVGITKERMAELIDDVIRAYALLGVYIEPPPPLEQEEY
jgi:hypothetical protein